MSKMKTLVSQVRRNCDISDSEHAGLYTVCGLALRLRDLYKWENGLPPWEERDSHEILEWIDDKEEMWNTLPKGVFLSLSVFGNEHDPFDTGGINARLEPEGFYYGAGYARRLKPTFFLAPIEEKRKINGHEVYTLGHELARDLLTIPALNQDGAILLRKGSAMQFLWDQIVYIKESGRQALRFALDQCGIKDDAPSTMREGLQAVFAVQKETYVYHEIGELQDKTFDRKVWQEIIATFPHTPVELLARAIKDILADTCQFGPLRNMVAKRKATGVAFYAAFLDGLVRELFPEFRPAFKTFIKTGHWETMENAISSGRANAKESARVLTELYQAGKQKGDTGWAREEIEQRLLGHIKGLGRQAK